MKLSLTLPNIKCFNVIIAETTRRSCQNGQYANGETISLQNV